MSMQMKAQASPAYTFTDAQLAIYGIYELQVLESVLRQDPNTLGYLENDRHGVRQDSRKDSLSGSGDR